MPSKKHRRGHQYSRYVLIYPYGCRAIFDAVFTGPYGYEAAVDAAATIQKAIVSTAPILHRSGGEIPRKIIYATELPRARKTTKEKT